MIPEEIIHCLEELKQFANKDGIIEVVMRDKAMKFRDIRKLAINNLSNDEERALLKKAVDSMMQNDAKLDKMDADLEGLMKLQKINIVFSVLNLCATCAGFAIMYHKLDKMSGQINQLMSTIKRGNDVQTKYEFEKIVSEHMNMLDARKTQKYYSEEQMRKLVDDECNVLNLLIDVFMEEISEGRDNLIVSIYSMAAMLTVSMRYFDELYYFNNREVVGEGVWHASHDSKWVETIKKLNSNEFISRIQDYCVFEANLTTFETDAYYNNLCDQVNDMITNIKDNQRLVVELGSENMVAAYKEYIKQEVCNSAERAINETEGFKQNTNVTQAFNKAMEQLALVG